MLDSLKKSSMKRVPNGRVPAPRRRSHKGYLRAGLSLGALDCCSKLKSLGFQELVLILITIANNNKLKGKDLDLARERRRLDITKCEALLRYASKGDWLTAKTLIDEDTRLASEPITETNETLLHIAAGAGRTQFVERLLELPEMDNAALEQEDGNGNSAFCYAVAAGAKEIAEMLLQKNHNLLNLRSSTHGVTPLYYAALFGHSEMANFLYADTSLELTSKDKVDIFFTSIDAGLYDLALKLLAQNHDLAVARRQDGTTTLHVLARRPGAFDNANDSLTTKNLSDLALKVLAQNAKQAVAHRQNETALHVLALRSCAFDNANNSSRTKNFKLPGLGYLFSGKKLGHSKAFELCHLLWEKMEVQEDVKALIREPTHLLFDAARNGNFQIVEQLIHSDPDLTLERNKDHHTIFHAAVLHRHANIFRLIHEIGPIKDVITSYKDEKDNNMLHLIARLPDQNDEPSLTFGAALELRRELLWFKVSMFSWFECICNVVGSEGGNAPFIMGTAKQGRPDASKIIHGGAQEFNREGILVAMVILAEALKLIREHHNKNADEFCIFGTAGVIASTSSSIALWIFLTRLVHLQAQRGSEIFKTYKLIIGLSALLISMISLLAAFFTTFALGSGNIVDGLASISRLLFRGSSELFLRLLESYLLH